MALYTDIFGRLDWLTKTVKRLCCAVDKNTAAIAEAAANNPCYVEIVWNDITNAIYRNLAGYVGGSTYDTGGTPFTGFVEAGNTQRLYGGSNIILTAGLLGNPANIVSINDPCGTFTTVSDATFQNSTTLSYINLTGVTLILNNAFSGCIALSYVNIPNVVNILDGTFNNCAALTTVTFPNLLSIPYATFNGCVSLSTITAPKITSIGSTAFQGCISLTSISFPKVTSIASGNNFANCISLMTANLPAATFIGPTAFQTCTALTTINLNSVINLGGTPGDDGVFGDMSGQTIILTVPVAQATIDGGNPDGDILYFLSTNPGSTVNYI
jgi:hypothetical protein